MSNLMAMKPRILKLLLSLSRNSCKQMMSKLWEMDWREARLHLAPLQFHCNSLRSLERFLESLRECLLEGVSKLSERGNVRKILRVI